MDDSKQDGGMDVLSFSELLDYVPAMYSTVSTYVPTPRTYIQTPYPAVKEFWTQRMTKKRQTHAD